MRYYILNTKEESDECIKACTEAYLSNEPKLEYKKQTAVWAQQLQRLTDGKYIIPVCPQLGGFGYQIETFEENWFPVSGKLMEVDAAYIDYFIPKG